MDRKIKVGIIGIGGICRGAHLHAYELMADRVEIVAMCDIIVERAREQAERFHVPYVFSDYHDLLALEELDAVDICTPNYLHSVIAVEALNRGLHVFTEKPDAVSVAEAEKMKSAAEKNGKTLMAMRNNRYMPVSSFLKKYIGDGKMGEIYAARCGWQRRRGIPGKGGWFTTKEQSGGGPLIDLGVHMIDLAMWFMDFPQPVAVTAMTYNCFSDSDVSDSVNSDFGDKKEDGVFDVEDLAVGSIRFANGAVLQLEISWASNVEKEQRYVELRGTKAGATWTPDRVMLYEEGKKGKQFTSTVQRTPIVEEHAVNISNFIDVLEGSDKPVYAMYQGAMMMKIIDALYESAENDGREVLL